MRISRTEIIWTIIIVGVVGTSYVYVSGEIAGITAEAKWSTLPTGVRLRAYMPSIIPLALLTLLLLLLTFYRKRLRISLWKFCAGLPMPNSLALSPMTRFVERLLTNDYDLQRRGLKYLPADTCTLLDVGCGGATYLNNVNAYKMGVDVNPKRLAIAARHCKPICRDLREGFRDIKADVAVCFEVIEHLTGDEGTELLKELEGYPFVVLSTPREFFEVNRDGAEKHRSLWNEEKLQTHGYELKERCTIPPSNIYIRRNPNG